MIAILKVLITFAVLLLLAYPLIPAKGKLKKYFPAASLRYDHPENKRNLPFIILIVAEFVLTAILFGLFDNLVDYVGSIPFVANLFAGIANILNPQIDFILFTVRFVLVNLALLYIYVSVKSVLKHGVIDTFFRIVNKRQQKKQANQSEEDGSSEDGSDEDGLSEEERKKLEKRHNRIPFFFHSEPDENDGKSVEAAEDGKNSAEDENKNQGEGKNEDKKKEKYGPVASFILGLFFEGEDLDIALPWVVRVRTVLQCFIVLIEILYAFFMLTVLLAMFFPLPMALYEFLIDFAHIGDWYLYPIISVLFLQEICNFFRTPAASDEKHCDSEEDEKKKEQEERDFEKKLHKLLSTLKRHFDSEHTLRYYPQSKGEEAEEYEPQSLAYKSAMQFIAGEMKTRTGRTVQSYMQCLDACFSDNHVYFASSFYSELGGYLTAYTYIRLLSGARMIFVVSNPAERSDLRAFLSERLIRLTGSSATNSWRIHTSDERIDQADVLILSPADFEDPNLVIQHPDFFNEAANAVFLDVDYMINMDSYACPVMALMLLKATKERIRFIFLTEDFYAGFAARSLPKFFCVDPILSFTSAKENESVSYVLWNRETKSHRIYNEHGQKTTGLDYLIADLACKHDIDGVRVLSDAPIDHAERKILTDHGAEVNTFHRDAVDVNYMIYSDERSNLSASIYACTRFRGQKKSVVHILSKPYLLREYFIDRAATENFVNRTSFIQPRVPEHIDDHKLSLLRIFCDFATDDDRTVTEFEKRMREAIFNSMECANVISSAFCRKMLAEHAVEELLYTDLAAYLIAGLCDTDIGNEADDQAAVLRSMGNRAKEFYLVVDPAVSDGYSVRKEKYIMFNREREVLCKLFECNSRVEMRLNDELLGYAETFPLRTHLEFIAGQSIIYNNSEYEIEHVSQDGRTIYLRSENVKLSHCLDSVHLRRYYMESLTPIPKHTGVLHNTKLTLEEIRVTECIAKFTAETYGFYGLTSDKQTLDFYHKDGVDGNPNVESPNIRHLADGRALKIELKTRMTCTDGMRMLLAAVFNEFIRTIFPKTHYAIAIVPFLETPLRFDKDTQPTSEIERISALYPYFVHPTDEFTETDSNRITLLMLNDCYEDVGAFQWFYDLSGRYMQEFLGNIYSYLNWLSKRPNKNHYIYFGGEALPECYDLKGCCSLLYGYNRILAELGETDIETASENLGEGQKERCAFCHKEVESGRYSLFDNNRYICAECLDVVDNIELLNRLYAEMREYLASSYPQFPIGKASAAIDPIYELTAEQVLSEYYYRVDLTERVIFVERDDPVTNVCVSLLRGLIEIWQSDNELINLYSKAQLYYEELIFLRQKGLNESADWIYNSLDEKLRTQIDEISAYTSVSVAPLQVSEDIAPENEDKQAENGLEENIAELNSESGTEEKRTSFGFMCENRNDYDTEFEDDGFFGEDEFESLYDPNKVPRFWKRYLRNLPIDDGKEENTSEAEIVSDETAETDENGNSQEAPVPENKDGQSEKRKKRFSLFGSSVSDGEKILPHEEDEATNPKIRIYNDIIRHAYDYSEEPFDRTGVSDDMLTRIFYLALGDYPEIFWVETCAYSALSISLKFRCKTPNGKLDIKQIERKRRELKRAAKAFTRGIYRRTDPYKALTTIYRRLVLRTDYDTVGLNAGISNDLTRDDKLRSLYSTLVEHKVVCAGYAVAMQYLLQSVGIVAGYVISEKDASDVCHAFNILKLGKYCYYLDATWGDPSRTDEGDENKNRVDYDYFCVPFEEFIQAHPAQVTMHCPRKELYPDLNLFHNSNHEYFRYRNAYLKHYDEEEITRIICEAASNYDAKAMGDFAIGIRLPTLTDAEIVTEKLLSGGNLSRLIGLAKAKVNKKKQAELLEGRFCIATGYSGVIYIRPYIS